MTYLVDLTQEELDSWCAALESDDFVQGQGELSYVDNACQQRHCCLGVLRDVLKMHGEVIPGFGRYSLVTRWPKETHWKLPSMVQTLLSGKNDRGTSFPEIAAWIRENLRPQEAA